MVEEEREELNLPVISAEAITEEAAAAAEKAGERASFSLFKDAEVQALVLERLGIRQGGFVGQGPLCYEEVFDPLHRSKLAQRLVGHNAFDVCYLPLLKSLCSTSLWPAVIRQIPRSLFPGLPSLELCAALCTRILCTARRVKKKGKQRLVVAGIGGGDALLEASIALHLAAVLQQPVDLGARSVKLQSSERVDIEFVAFFCEDVRRTASDNLKPAKTPGCDSQMSVRHIALVEELVSSMDPVYLLCGEVRTDLGSYWGLGLSGGQLADQLEEICFVQAPVLLKKAGLLGIGLQNLTASTSADVRITELFPKTLCVQDFLGRGFREARPEAASPPEAGLFHAHLSLVTRKKAGLPFLVPQLCHTLGPYDLRLKADRNLEGVHYLRTAGIVHACNLEHLHNPMPEGVIESLKRALYRRGSSAEVSSLRMMLQAAIPFCDGRARKQLTLLFENSAAYVDGKGVEPK